MRLHYYCFPFKFSSSLFLLSRTTSHNTVSSVNSKYCLSFSFFFCPCHRRPNYTSRIAAIYREYIRDHEDHFALLSHALLHRRQRMFHGNIIRDKVGRSREKIIYTMLFYDRHHMRASINWFADAIKARDSWPQGPRASFRRSKTKTTSTTMKLSLNIK